MTLVFPQEIMQLSLCTTFKNDWSKQYRLSAGEGTALQRISAVGALKKALISHPGPMVKKAAAGAITKKSVDIAKQGVVLKKISKQLKKHAAVAPTGKRIALKKHAQHAQRKANAKNRAAATLVKSALPTTLKKLRVIKKKGSPMKKVAVRHIIRSLHKPSAPATAVRKALTVNHRAAVAKGTRAVKVLKKMIKKGMIVTPKRANKMVKKAAGKPSPMKKSAIMKKLGVSPLKKSAIMKKLGVSPLKKSAIMKKLAVSPLKKSAIMKKLGVSSHTAKILKKKATIMKKAAILKKLGVPSKAANILAHKRSAAAAAAASG